MPIQRGGSNSHTEQGHDTAEETAIQNLLAVDAPSAHSQNTKEKMTKMQMISKVNIQCPGKYVQLVFDAISKEMQREVGQTNPVPMKMQFSKSK